MMIKKGLKKGQIPLKKLWSMRGEKGSFTKKVWEYSKSIFMGGSDFAERFYEDHVNPGYSGKERQNHLTKWLHTSGKHLWSVFSEFHQGLSTRDGP